jgi:site-specific recombinase XerD
MSHQGPDLNAILVFAAVAGPEQIRAYQVYLTMEKKLASGSILIAVSALRFLYKVTLKKDWTFDAVIPAPQKPQTLPVVLSPEEVLQFLACVASRKHRAILTTCYGAGLLRSITCLSPCAQRSASSRIIPGPSIYRG